MRLRNLFVLGSIAMSLALPQLALCADTTDGKAGAEKAKIDETKAKDRGVAFTPMHESVGSVTAPPVVKKTDISTTKPTEKRVEVAKSKQAKQPILTAVQKTKRDNKVTATAHAGSKVVAPSIKQTLQNQPTEVAGTPKQDQSSVQFVKFSPSEAGAVISARLDRNGTLPVYKIGDKMTVNVKANQDCNVVVFNYDSTGTLTQIFPNDFQPNGFVKSGEAVEIGGAASPFDYQIAGKGGPEKVFVYAYPVGSDFKNPITAMGGKVGTVAMAPIAGTPFRGGEMTVDQYRAMVNNSSVFFSRSVEVKPRSHSAQAVSSLPAASPNKVELTFTVEK